MISYEFVAIWNILNSADGGCICDEMCFGGGDFDVVPKSVTSYARCLYFEVPVCLVARDDTCVYLGSLERVCMRHRSNLCTCNIPLTSVS